MMIISYIRSFVYVYICLCLTLSIVNAGTVVIRSFDDFLGFANNVSDGVIHDVILKSDIFFSSSFKSIGTSSDEKRCFPYSGVFDGQGHVIGGLSMKKTGGNVGLFCALANAEIKNLIINETCSFSGDHAGSLSPRVSGDITLKNVVNKATVIGRFSVGGFFGDVDGSNIKSVIIENCSNYGSVTEEDHDVPSICGGMISVIANTTNCNVTIVNSINNGNVAGNRYGNGGFIGLIEGNDRMSFHMSDCRNLGNLTNTNQKVVNPLAAGFIGYIHQNQNVIMSVVSVVNDGICIHIDQTRSSICAGVAGVFRQNTDLDVTIDRATNNGYLYARNAGGLVEAFNDNKRINVTLKNCINNGNIRLFDGNDCCYPGGIVGVINGENQNLRAVLTNNTNNGSITTNITSNICYVGGIVGIILRNNEISFAMISNTNNASLKNIGSQGSRIGGLIGYMNSITRVEKAIIIEHGINNGTVDAGTGDNDQAGGIIGYVENPQDGDFSLILNDCENNGTVTSRGASRGLIGVSDDSDFSIEIHNCINKGSVRGGSSFGISDRVNEADNIVSLGCVEGDSLSRSFWESSSTSSSLFCNNICNDCRSSNENISSFEEKDGIYIVDGQHLVWILNNNSLKRGDEQGWNEALDIFSFSVYFGYPLNQVVQVIPGAPLSSMHPLLDEWVRFQWFDSSSATELEKSSSNTKAFRGSTLVSTNLKLTAYHSVCVTEFNYEMFVKSGTTLGNLSCMGQDTFVTYVLTEGDNSAVVLKESEIVNRDMTINVSRSAVITIVFYDDGSNVDDAILEILLFLRGYGIPDKDHDVKRQNDGTILVVLTTADKKVSSLMDLLLKCNGTDDNSWEPLP